MPGTLICDSMASACMREKGVDVVVVGADRVAANGDTANKVQEYTLHKRHSYCVVYIIILCVREIYTFFNLQV